jgi:hypothetical protein
MGYCGAPSCSYRQESHHTIALAAARERDNQSAPRVIATVDSFADSPRQMPGERQNNGTPIRSSDVRSLRRRQRATSYGPPFREKQFSLADVL